MKHVIRQPLPANVHPSARMIERVPLIDGHDSTELFPTVNRNPSGPSRRAEHLQNVLTDNLQPSHTNRIEHDLHHPLSVHSGVQEGLTEEKIVILWVHSELFLH